MPKNADQFSLSLGTLPGVLAAPFENRVLQAVNVLRGEAYGAKIRQKLSEALGRDVAIGQVYITLSRLENKGYVSSTMGNPEPVRGGRAKRLFKIEAPGIKALEIVAAANVAAGAFSFTEKMHAEPKTRAHQPP